MNKRNGWIALFSAALMWFATMGDALALPYDVYKICVAPHKRPPRPDAPEGTTVRAERYATCWLTSGVPTPSSAHDNSTSGVGAGLNGNLGNASDPSDLSCASLRNRIDSMKGRLDDLRAVESQLSDLQKDAFAVFSDADDAYFALDRVSSAETRACEAAIAAVAVPAYSHSTNVCRNKRGQVRADCIEAQWSSAPGAAAAEAKCTQAGVSTALTNRAQKASAEAARQNNILTTRLADVKKSIAKLQIRMKAYQKAAVAHQCPR